MLDQAIKLYREKNKRIFDPDKKFNRSDVELDCLRRRKMSVS